MLSPSQDPPFAVFDFTLTREDFLKLHHERIAVSDEWRTYIAASGKRARWHTAGGLLGAAGGLILMVAAAYNWPPSESNVALGFLVVMISAFVIHTGSNIRATLKRQIDGKPLAERSRTDAYNWCAWHIECYNDGVRLTTPFRDTLSRWTVFTGVAEYPSFVVLEEVGRAAYPIPKGRFVTPEAVRTFMLTVDTLLRERGAGVGDRIRAYLVAHDAACPACRYALRGSAGLMCPECGLALTLAMVPGAVEQPPPMAGAPMDTLASREQPPVRNRP